MGWFSSWRRGKTATNNAGEGNDKEHESAKTTQQQQDEEEDQEQQQQQQREIDQKQRMLSDQKEREEKAKAVGAFVKNQSARYHHKLSGEWFDAQIVGVHHDDGVENPYYTIQYHKSVPSSAAEGEEGEQQQERILVEKQTTGDRLEHVEWDEEVAWSILSKKLARP